MTDIEKTAGTAVPTATGHLLTFERTLPHPIGTVWAALTEDDSISKWLGGPGSSLEPRVGGRVWLPAHLPGVDSTVTVFEPPHVLQFDFRSAEWNGGPIRWELFEIDGGTRLVFTHELPPEDPETTAKLAERFGFTDDMYDQLPRTLAGWHQLLDALAQTLDGQPVRQDEAAWRGPHRYYLQAYGN